MAINTAGYQIMKSWQCSWNAILLTTVLHVSASWRLVVLTSSLGGLNIIWSIIMSNGTPFILSLGFSKSAASIIWTLAPICGTIVQPYFGIVSDRHQHTWGRRKPFMLGGAMAIIISLLGFASSEGTAVGLMLACGYDPTDWETRMAVKIAAVLWFLLLNISIQPLQVASRAFIVENCSRDEQVLAHAWASRVQGVGSITGLMLGSLNLPLIWTTEISQFSILCLISCSLLLVTVLISCFSIQGESAQLISTMQVEQLSFITKLTTILFSVREIPRSLQRVCCIQFFAWMGWFPFLVYYTTYISRFYLSNHVEPEKVADDAIQGDAVRMGSLAGLLLAFLALVSNFAIPLLINMFHAVKGNKNREHHAESQSNVTIGYVWLLGHAYFIAAMIMTFVVTSELGSVLLVSSVGISWAITLWVPYCLIGVVLSKRQRLDLGSESVPGSGAVMGVHNASISAPQILSALICALLFAGYEGSENSVVWAMRIGGCGTIVAAILSWKLIDELEDL